MTWDDWAPAVARYFAMISQVDDMFGRVLAALDAAGAAQNTIVYFTSDHGDMCGSHGMLDKHYVLYDDVMAVPMAVRWPGHIAPGTVVNDYVSQCLDFAPTVEELLGREPPAHLHGHSLVPLLRGQAQSRRPAYAVASGNGQQFGLYTQRALRTDVYKYVWNLTDTDELYDLQADPGELHNRIADPALADTLADLRRDLRAELIRQEDPFARSGWLDGQLLRGCKA